MPGSRQALDGGGTRRLAVKRKEDPAAFPLARNLQTFDGGAAPEMAVECLVFRLIHLDPALTMAMAFLARRCEARMGLALAVHVKGFGFWLRCSIHSSIAPSSCATLWKMPRRMRWRVISAKSHSTRLSHELDVGVKCSLKRLCRASQRFTFSVLCVAYLSMTRYRSRWAGVSRSIFLRNAKNSSGLWRGRHSPMTLPVATSSAAKSVVVPLRL